tara:strand:+ start:25209 stop:25430 length:222 start_codon:yes stop_codon:yes gene_type:complete
MNDEILKSKKDLIKKYEEIASNNEAEAWGDEYDYWKMKFRKELFDYETLCDETGTREDYLDVFREVCEIRGWE